MPIKSTRETCKGSERCEPDKRCYRDGTMACLSHLLHASPVSLFSVWAPTRVLNAVLQRTVKQTDNKIVSLWKRMMPEFAKWKTIFIAFESTVNLHQHHIHTKARCPEDCLWCANRAKQFHLLTYQCNGQPVITTASFAVTTAQATVGVIGCL